MLRRECLDRLLILGERAMFAACWPNTPGMTMATARTRPGGRNHRCEPGHAVDVTARIGRRQVLGGLISEYRRAA